MKFDQNTKIVILEFLRSAFNQDAIATENSILNFAKPIKKTDPKFYREIISVLYNRSNKGSSLRGGADPLPIDLDSKLETAQIFNPDPGFPKPVFDMVLDTKIDDFLEQQSNVEILIENNLFPPSKILLVGPPGTGKTMLAKYIAAKLNKELIILDLATVISSFLGKTGLNLKRVLDYAKRNKVILLLDEFDAIAKRRDDLSDLGELKRVVNILLVELDNWPSGSILIATSNHPDLLDRAVWRRFDETYLIDSPSEEVIQQLLRDNLPGFKPSTIQIISPFLVGKSAADVCSYANKVKRRVVMKKTDNTKSAFLELGSFVHKDIKGDLCRKAKEILGDSVTIRQLAQITDLSPSGVHYHLAKEGQHA